MGVGVLSRLDTARFPLELLLHPHGVKHKQTHTRTAGAAAAAPPARRAAPRAPPAPPGPALPALRCRSGS